MVGGAYVEGWGLYSERLADEMGLYRDEARAVRDARRARPGARRGSSSTPGCTPCAGRASARSTSCATAGLSETDAVIETDRYICWPGQALTYKIGQREIERLRARARRRATASAFDLRAFHDAVLGHGSLPLATLPGAARWVADP